MLSRETKQTQTSTFEADVLRGSLKGDDFGASAVRAFVEGHPHEGWTLSVRNEQTGYNLEIDCIPDDMSKVVAHICKREGAGDVVSIGENPEAEAYVVALDGCKGRYHYPGIYEAKDGLLFDLALRRGEYF